MRISIIAAAVASALTLAQPGLAQTGGNVTVASQPGAVGIAQTVEFAATISAIDKASRTLTLKGPKGEEVKVVAGPEVKNFDQLKVGDAVDIEYIAALTLELKKGGGLVVQRTIETGAAGAKPGQTPAGIAGRQVTVVADVVAVDPAKKTVTLKGPKQTVELPVRDPEVFKKVAKGDQVEATFTQALAMAVVPKAKK